MNQYTPSIRRCCITQTRNERPCSRAAASHSQASPRLSAVTRSRPTYPLSCARLPISFSFSMGAPPEPLTAHRCRRVCDPTAPLHHPQPSPSFWTSSPGERAGASARTGIVDGRAVGATKIFASFRCYSLGCHVILPGPMQQPLAGLALISAAMGSGQGFVPGAPHLATTKRTWGRRQPWPQASRGQSLAAVASCWRLLAPIESAVLLGESCLPRGDIAWLVFPSHPISSRRDIKRPSPPLLPIQALPSLPFLPRAVS